MAGKQRSADIEANELANKIKKWNDENNDIDALMAELLAHKHTPKDGERDETEFTAEERCRHAIGQIRRALSFKNDSMAAYYYRLACSHCGAIPTDIINAMQSKQPPKIKPGKKPLDPCIGALRLGQAESLMLHIGLTANAACELVAEGLTNGLKEEITGGAIYRDWDSRRDIYRKCLNATNGLLSFSPYYDLDDPLSLVDAKIDAIKFPDKVREAMLKTPNIKNDKTILKLLKAYFA